MKKFEFNSLRGYFSIDPKYLSEGLKAAAGKYSSICIQPMDSRLHDISFDMADLSDATWIKQLVVHQDVTTDKRDFNGLERLTKLESLGIKELAPLDYSKLKELKTLGLVSGTSLTGLEKLSNLEYVDLSLWNRENLPSNIGLIAANKVRLILSKKLKSIEPLCNASHLTNLKLRALPALTVGKEINKLDSLEELSVEKCRWTDFSQLRIDSLRKLFVSKAESLRFIKQLKHLEDLFFWDCVDGDLTPVLEHPTLEKINFTPEKKHYSHKLAELRRLLAAKRVGKT